jgi:hypothetical protein
MSGQNVVPMKTGGQILGIVPQNLDEIFRLASGISKSGLAPKDMSTPEKVMVAIMTGMEIGLPPMFAIQKIAVINGRPSLWGDAIPALLLSRGFKLKESFEFEDDARVAHCHVTRPDGDITWRKFGVKDARKAGLWGKSGPWSQYPDRMLQMRARGFAARDGAADVLGGLYLREELDEPMRDVTPAPVALELPDIPDEPAQPETVTQDIEQDDAPITDVEGWLEHLQARRDDCESEAELAELQKEVEAALPRLPTGSRSKASDIVRAE